ncbi:MAG: DUF502 domain-containing protein [bacterium]|nr:DUF502 domain-containing protein [bacterium]
MKSLEKHIMNCLIGGVVAVLPIFGLAIFIGYMELQIASSGIGKLEFYFPGLGIIISIIIIYLLGLFVTTIAGKWVWNRFDKFFNKLPVLGQVYKMIKEILGYDTDTDSVFKQVVLVPSVFGKGEELGLVTSSFVEDDITKLVVFVPSAPTPTTGRLVYINETDTRLLNISAADTFKTLISMGKTDVIKNIK